MLLSRKFILLFALAALALSNSPPAIADGYTVTDLGALPGQPYSSIWQQTINNSGEVAAYANSNADEVASSFTTATWESRTVP